MNLSNIFLLSLTVLFFTACSHRYYVASDFEKEINFEVYKSYKVYNHKDGFSIGANPICK